MTSNEQTEASPEKDPIAAAMAAKRWAKPEWKTAKARSEFMRHVASFSPRTGAGRKPAPDRCPCGEMTRARALKRGHVCKRGGRK